MSIESRSRQYGKVFDHWQIREFLGSGSGGKSVVFRLVHSSSSVVKSALKVISLIEKRGDFESLSESRKAEYNQVKQKCKTCAEQEVMLMNGLQGRTNVVDYLDHTFVDWADENGFGCDMLIRMELLKDLRSQIDNDHQFSQDEVLKIGRDICSALVLCHRKKILHRDIKPENIFYNDDGNYKLGDFGVSRILSASPMSKASTGVCTPEYAAPEQLSGKYDIRVDIYSLGLVLYELSNGNLLPFASSTYITELEVQERMMGKPLSSPQNASKSFAAVILKACAYNPDDRYQTAEEFLAELNYLAGVGPRPAIKTSSSGRTTQKANHSGDRNATQYATGDSTPRRTRKKEPIRSRPKCPKPIIIGIVLFLVAGISFAAVWGFNAAADKEAIAGIIDDVNTLCNAKNYGEAITKIQDGLDEYPHSDELEEKLNEVVSLQTDSNIAAAIADAEKYVSAGDYETAIATLETGLSSYPESSSLQSKMSEYSEALAAEIKAKTLEDAKNLADVGEYESAMSLIKAAQEAYGNNKEYDNAYATYHKAYSLKEAETYVNNGDYSSAITLLRNAQKINANDVDLIATYNSYCDRYVAEVIASADTLLAEWKINEAIAEVKNGIKIVPDNAQLTEKLDILNASKPVSITTLTSINSSRWNWNEGKAVDPFGNDYSSACNYAIFHNKSHDERSIEYRVYGDYKTVSGVVAPHAEIDENRTCNVLVYADDQLVYTSPAIGQKTDAFTFSADITDAEYIKIEIRFNGYYVFDIFVDQLIVSDVQLWP